jgi:hypothetical protein
MIVASSGTLALFEKFRELIGEHVASPDCDHTVVGATYQIETITRQINAAYHDILLGKDFDVLLGIKSTVSAVLRYVYSEGLAEGVRKYKVIGHGEPYGSFFLKRWWRPDMTMIDVAELGFFIIKYIQGFELDNSVGVGDEDPQIMLIPHEPVIETTPLEIARSLMPHSLAEHEMQSLRHKVKQRLTKFKRISW